LLYEVKFNKDVMQLIIRLSLFGDRDYRLDLVISNRHFCDSVRPYDYIYFFRPWMKKAA